MQYKLIVPILALICVALPSCSSEPDDEKSRKEHVWKEQTGAIDKAREVESILKRGQENKQQ